MQEIYAEPIKPELVGRRVQEMRDGGVTTAASLTPQRVRDYAHLTVEAGLDLLVVQGTVVSAEHVSSPREPLNLKEFIAELRAAGDRGRLRLVLDRAAPDADRARSACSSVSAPAHACTTRGVLGIGVPAGHRHRRRRRRPHPPPRRDGPLRARHRRRRHAHRRRHRQGDRLRGRRGDDRLADRRAPTRRPAGATTGAWPPSTRSCPAAPGSRWAAGHRWRRSCSARPTRTTGAATCSAALRTSMATIRLRDRQGVPEGRGHGGARRCRPRARSSSASQGVGMG